MPYLRAFLDLRIYGYFASLTGLFKAEIFNFLHSIYYKISKSLPIEEYRFYHILQTTNILNYDPKDKKFPNMT